MDGLQAVEAGLKAQVPDELVDDLFRALATAKRDYLLGSTYSSAIGHLVETVTQILQHIETGKYEKKPSVDDYLRKLESRAVSMPDSLKVVVSRASRSLYTFRNKRACHKGEVNPNAMDSRYMLACAQWIVAEVVRVVAGLGPDEAQAAIETITAPISGVIEDFGKFRTVLPECSIEQEVLLLLMHYYPEWTEPARLKQDMKRTNPNTVGTTLHRLCNRKDRLVDRNGRLYKLTGNGVRVVEKLYESLMRG